MKNARERHSAIGRSSLRNLASKNPIHEEMKPWNLESEPHAFDLINENPEYALIIVMAGDCKLISDRVASDLDEMARGIMGGDEITVLALADTLIPQHKTEVHELSGQRRILHGTWPSTDTGDPRPIANFLATALNSFSPETRIALGFWGHGQGVVGDLDPNENLIPSSLRTLPLGNQITEAMFLDQYRPEPKPMKPLISKAMFPDMTSGNVLTNRELSSALAVAFSRCRRTEPADLIFFDTCLNGSVEVFTEMGRFAKVFLGSSILLPKTGWNYVWFLQTTRQERPQNAHDWARAAIYAFQKAYDPRLYLTPVHLAAINCQTDALEKLRDVVTHVRLLGDRQAAQLLYRAGSSLKTTGYDESVDLLSLIDVIAQETESSELQISCNQFVRSFENAVICSVKPDKTGESHRSLSVWFPRMGDRLDVHHYYGKLLFHSATDWLSIVRYFVDFKEDLIPKIFVIEAFIDIQILSEEPIFKTALVNDTALGEQVVHVNTSEETTSWAFNLDEGKYSFESSSSVTFSSPEYFQSFTTFLTEIRFRDNEFQVLVDATEREVVADEATLGDLGYHLQKYYWIVVDEFPEFLKAYEHLNNLVTKAMAARSFLVLNTRNEVFTPDR